MGQWQHAGDCDARAPIWGQMLADLGGSGLYNRHRRGYPAAGGRVPATAQRAGTGMWAFEPGAHFGVYKPDTFWLDEPGPLSPVAENK